MQDISNEEKSLLDDIEDEEYDIYDEEDENEDEDYEEYEEEVILKDVTNEEDLIIQDMADFLKIFGNYARIKILECIMDIKYTVGDLSIFTGLTQSAVSHHLKVLKQAKLVVGVQSGKFIYYQVSDKHIKEIYKLTRSHIEEFQKTISAKEENDEMADIFNKEIDSEKYLY